MRLIWSDLLKKLYVSLYQLPKASAFEIGTPFYESLSALQSKNEQISFKKTFYDVHPVRLAVCLQTQPHRHWDRHHRRPQNQWQGMYDIDCRARRENPQIIGCISRAAFWKHFNESGLIHFFTCPRQALSDGTNFELQNGFKETGEKIAIL